MEIILLVVVIISGILNLWLIWQKVNFNENLAQIKNEIRLLEENSKGLVCRNDKLVKEIEENEEKFDKKYAELFAMYTKSMRDSTEYRTKVVEYEGQLGKLKFLENEIDNYQKLLADKKVELDNLSLSGAAILADQDEKLRKSKELETSIEALERRIVEYCERERELKEGIVNIEGELSNLVLLKTSVLQIEEGAGNRWELNVADAGKIRFLELIETLISEYGAAVPELRTGLAKIAWSSVWLPMIQELCGREGLDGRGGIYKLTSKVDERVCYIGQATNIKDRWYTHIKKMVGVEAKGLERLYTYRPDELYWEVVEFKDGDLDSDEHYWIEYYKSKEIGLNKKR